MKQCARSITVGIVLVCIFGRFADAAEERPPVQINRPQITLPSAVDLFNREFYIPIKSNSADESDESFRLSIDEKTPQRAIAELCRQAPASIDTSYGDMAFLRQARLPPLKRIDLPDGSVYLLQGVDLSKSREPGKKLDQSVWLDAVLLTENDRAMFAVSPFLDFTRFKDADGWHDVVPSKGGFRDSVNSFSWGVGGILQVGETRPTAIEGTIHFSRVIASEKITISNLADSNQPVIESAGVTCRRAAPDQQVGELAVLVLSGPSMQETFKRLTHKTASRFVEIYNGLDQRLDRKVKFSADFVNGEMVVRIIADNTLGIDHVTIWWPTEIKEEQMAVSIDPLPSIEAPTTAPAAGH